jgi:hypothetical protein
MKPYGLYIPMFLDVQDIKAMGAKGSVGTLRGRSGHFRGYSYGPSKARIRRYWKRVARAEGRRAAEVPALR